MRPMPSTWPSLVDQHQVEPLHRHLAVDRADLGHPGRVDQRVGHAGRRPAQRRSPGRGGGPRHVRVARPRPTDAALRPGTGTPRAARRGRRAASRSARRTRQPRRRRNGCRPLRRVRSAASAHEVPHRGLVARRREHRLEHRPHPVEQRVGPCGVEAGVELDLEEALRVLGAAGRSDLGDAAGLVRPSPTEGHRQQPDGAHARPGAAPR